MQIIDLSQLMLSAIFGSKRDLELNIDNLRGMMLAMIRNLNSKFRYRYGNLVIAVDGENPYWRTELFPHYKANRVKLREKSGLDWTQVKAVVGQFKAELDEYFPYKFIEIPHVEADDIIATLVCRNAEPIMIISSDHDYIQLHRDNVKQYDPIRDKFIYHDNPSGYLVEHVIKGDAGDGIPNVYSDDDVFINDAKRQVVMTEKRFDIAYSTWLYKLPDTDSKMRAGICRNERLIDLSMIPSDIQDKITESFNSQPERPRLMMRKYFMTHKLTYLSRSLGEF